MQTQKSKKKNINADRRVGVTEECRTVIHIRMIHDALDIHVHVLTVIIRRFGKELSQCSATVTAIEGVLGV
jgi:hypothetical protein